MLSRCHHDTIMSSCTHPNVGGLTTYHLTIQVTLLSNWIIIQKVLSSLFPNYCSSMVRSQLAKWCSLMVIKHLCLILDDRNVAKLPLVRKNGNPFYSARPLIIGFQGQSDSRIQGLNYTSASRYTWSNHEFEELLLVVSVETLTGLIIIQRI